MSIYKYNEKYGWTEIEPGTPAFGKTQNQIYANLKKIRFPQIIYMYMLKIIHLRLV